MESYDGFPTTQTSGFLYPGLGKEKTVFIPVYPAKKRQAVYTWNGADCVNSSPVVCEGLGYEGKAVAVAKK